MQKEKSIGRNILIIFLIIVMIASVCAALFAWAKYQTTINGTATGETAKWSFKVSDGNTLTQDIDFPMTRTDSNTSVAEGKIAPGTYGKIEIGIDATGTETSLTYVIDGIIENLPTNIKFYSDAERTLDLTVLNNKFSKGGYMLLNDVGTKTETIYWEWPFETETKPTITEEKLVSLGINKTEFDALITDKKFAEANNMIDTAENEKQFSMSMSVTGKQLNGSPVLADLVQIGDYVNYNASSNGIKTITSADWSNGSRVLMREGENYVETSLSSDEDFNSSAKAQWRVLSVDRNTGKVELMSTSPSEKVVELKGGNGFAYGVIALDKIGATYGQGKGAVAGRCLKIEDVEKYLSFNKNTYIEPEPHNSQYGDNVVYATGYFYKEVRDNNGNIIGYETNRTTAVDEDGKRVTMTQTSYAVSNAIKYCVNSIVYDMIFSDKTVWLASQAVRLNNNNTCNFYLRRLGTGKITSGYLYSSNDSGTGNSSEKLPISIVVSLENNIKTTGQDSNGVWQLDV